MGDNIAVGVLEEILLDFVHCPYFYLFKTKAGAEKVARALEEYAKS